MNHRFCLHLALALLLLLDCGGSAQSKAPPSNQKSMDVLKQKAANGDVASQVALAKQYSLRGDYAQAVTWYRKAAEQGNAFAQFILGTEYDIGQGVPQDYAKAVTWYRKAAEQGNAFAQFNLGFMYDNGLGVPQDYSEAVSWYRKAAEQGNAGAEFNLGISYYNGEGVPQDYAEAYFWLDLAAAGSMSGAPPGPMAKYRDDAASHLAPADLTRVQERARKWFEAHPVTPE